MKLLTKTILNKLPRLYETEEQCEDEKKVMVKFFNPCGIDTWYGIEYDPEEELFFGYYVNRFGGSLGYFSLKELEKLKLPFGLSVERDKYFKPTKLGKVKEELKAYGYSL